MRRAIVVLLALSAPVLAASFRPFAGMRGDTVPAWTTPQGSPSTPDPTFDMFAGATSPNDLPDTLTVNSVALDLVCSLTAQDVNGTNLIGRTQSGTVTFSEAGAGTSPVVSALTPAHALDAAERGIFYAASQKYHQAGVDDCDLGSEDFVIEGVFGPARGTNAVSFANVDATAGIQLINNSTSNLRLLLKTGGAAVNIDGGNPSTWSHVIWFVDRDEATTNGAFAYTNGSPGTGVNASARTGSLSSTVAATLGYSLNNTTTVVGLRIWKCPSGTPQCFAGGATNPAQWAPIARQRAARAFGVAPIIARGDATPTTLTRATTAHVDVVDGNTRQLYLVGNNAPRVARRTSQGSPIAGYLSEPAVSNIALQSQTLETTWTPITVGDNVLTNAYAGADLTTTGDNIDGNNSNAEHGLRQSITVTATSHTFSAWAKTGTQNFVALRNATIANGTAWFDVATCTSSSCVVGEDCASAVGTVQAGVSQATASRWPIDTTGDGVADVNLCRVSITYTGTAAAHNHDLLCAPSNGVTTYTDADATADCGFWGVRVEAFSAPTSYLATTTASTARNADDLRFDGASHYTGSPSTMDTVVLCPNAIIDTTRTIVSVGPSSTDYARIGYVATTNRAQTVGVVSTTQWDMASSSGDIADGILHPLRATMQTNDIKLYSDNLQVATDTLATLPTVASSFIYFGTTAGGAVQPNCLINRARLWSSVVTP